MKTIVIIGGGASGMTAAIAAAETNPDVRVCILEHKDIPGKKILSTGNGRCNFTNEFMSISCYHSDNIDVAEKVIKRFDASWTLGFFEKLGIMPKSRNGYYYPQSDQASAVLDVLKMRLKLSGVQIKTNAHVTSVRNINGSFVIKTEDDTIHADKVILACGGKAAAKLGSDGSGYALAKSLGHSVIPVVPALVQLKVKNSPLAKASGVRCEAKVSVYADGKNMGEDTGELQITAYGISGIPVFQVSRHATKGILKKQKVHAAIDFLPALSEDECVAFFEKRRYGKEDLFVSEFLVGIFNRKLIPCLLKYAGIRNDVKISSFDKKQVKTFVYNLKHMKVDIESDNGFENAQVCAGGIGLSEISSDTMESLCCSGLYLAGELLDVDGICGGYNLQWAWASGYLAGRSAAEVLRS